MEVGWVPPSVLAGNGSGAPSVPIPDWAAPYISQEQWAQMVAEAQAASQSETPTGPGLSPGSVRAWSQWTPEQRFTSILNASAARALPQGADSPFSNDTIARLGILGAGVGSIFANMGAGAAGAGVGGGSAVPAAIPGATGGAAGAAGAGAAGAGAAGGGIGGAGAAGAGIATVPTLTGRALDYLPEIIAGGNALLGAHAAGRATDAETAAYQQAIDEQRRQYDTTRADLMPWLESGRVSLNRLNDPGMYFTASPDYQFRRSEGERDIGNSFAARGGAASGNALRALTEYNSNLASGEFNDWWNRQAGLAGVGQTTGTQLGQLGANTAGNVGNYLAGQGVSRASGVLGKYGALAQGATDVASNYLYRRRRAA